MCKTINNDLEHLLNDYQGLLRKAAGQNHLRSFYDEAYAEAVLSFCDAVKTFDENMGVPFAGYAKAKVYGSLYTLFKKHRRNWQREFSLDGSDDDNSPLSTAVLSSLEDDIINKNSLSDALQQLTVRQQQIINYTLIQGYTQIETAKIMKISQQAVASNKKQALIRLKDILL